MANLITVQHLLLKKTEGGICLTKKGAAVVCVCGCVHVIPVDACGVGQRWGDMSRGSAGHRCCPVFSDTGY